MGNIEGASRSGVRVFQTESVGSRAADRTSACGHDRQLTRHDAGRAHDPDTRLIQIVGRRGLTSGLAAISAIDGDSFRYSRVNPSHFDWNQIPDARASLLRSRGLVADPG